MKTSVQPSRRTPNGHRVARSCQFSALNRQPPPNEEPTCMAQVSKSGPRSLGTYGDSPSTGHPICLQVEAARADSTDCSMQGNPVSGSGILWNICLLSVVEVAHTGTHAGTIDRASRPPGDACYPSHDDIGTRVDMRASSHCGFFPSLETAGGWRPLMRPCPRRRFHGSRFGRTLHWPPRTSPRSTVEREIRGGLDLLASSHRASWPIASLSSSAPDTLLRSAGLRRTRRTPGHRPLMGPCHSRLAGGSMRSLAPVAGQDAAVSVPGACRKKSVPPRTQESEILKNFTRRHFASPKLRTSGVRNETSADSSVQKLHPSARQFLWENHDHQDN